LAGVGVVSVNTATAAATSVIAFNIEHTSFNQILTITQLKVFVKKTFVRRNKPWVCDFRWPG
jgi:hypothetical protein